MAETINWFTPAGVALKLTAFKLNLATYSYNIIPHDVFFTFDDDWLKEIIKKPRYQH